MSFWKRLICLFKGHETSLFPGIGAPAAFQWTYPGAEVPKVDPGPDPTRPAYGVPVPISSIIGTVGFTGPSRGGTGIHAVGGAGHGIVAHTGPAYNLDLCPRCMTLYMALPPPRCKHCHTEKGLHKDGVCDLPCQNCRRPLDAHIDGKCLFEASDYKGAVYALDS